MSFCWMLSFSITGGRGLNRLTGRADVSIRSFFRYNLARSRGQSAASGVQWEHEQVTGSRQVANGALTLVDGERILGRYTLVLLEHTAHGWAPSMLQLNSMVTNYRLVMKPFRRRYAPASIPRSYIREIDLVARGHHQSVMLRLREGSPLFFVLATGHLENLYDDLCAMRLPPPRFRFDESVARADIERLIAYFKQGMSPMI